MLINFHSMAADRGKGLNEMLRISSDLFGNIKNLIRSKHSLLIGITHSNRTLSLERLRGFICKDAPIEIRELEDRIFTFDPLER